MAESNKSIAIVPLKGSNYPTWKLQCRMVLMKEGLWTIVNGTKKAPEDGRPRNSQSSLLVETEHWHSLYCRSKPALLYLLGDLDDPVTVWKKLSDQFQKKSLANKLQLWRRLYSLRLTEGESVQEHIRKLTEIFDELAVIGNPVEEEEDRVVHLLASLPESYNVLVTVLEANSEVPKMEVVTERLLHEERKQKEKEGRTSSSSKALSVSRSKKVPKCFHCGKPGHIKKNCCLLATDNGKTKRSKGSQPGTNTASVGRHSEGESDALVVEQVLQAGTIGSWIVDSGATCHTCCNEKLFSELHLSVKQTDVTLGDGHTLEATGQGTVSLMMNLSDGSSRKCRLLDVLFVPSLTYNLLSVSKAAESGKEAKFDKNGYKILSAGSRVIAEAQRHGSL